MQYAKIFRIKVTTNENSTDLVSGILWELGALGVEVSEPIDLESLSFDYVDEALLQGDDVQTVVGGFFESDVSLELRDVLNNTKELCQWDMGALSIEVNIEQPTDWVEQFRQSFKSIDYGKVIVAPEWETVESNKPIIKLQLASAFGTGKHETTSMCIEKLQEYITDGCTVADIGCGSGILGLVALKLGAKHVTFGDIDTQAVETTQYNINLNNIDKSKYSLNQVAFLNGITDKFDILVANLTADLLEKLSKDIKQNMHSQSILIVSGIILDKIEATKKAFIQSGLGVKEEIIQGEWACLVLVQNS